MADVMVVAMFMTYIGFNGIITNQLGQLSSSVQELEILTTNGTSLQPRYYLFLTYTLLALFLSGFLTRKPHISQKSMEWPINFSEDLTPVGKGADEVKQILSFFLLSTKIKSLWICFLSIRNKHNTHQTTNIRPNYPHPINVSLNMLRFHQILRSNESLHISPLFPLI